MRTYGVKSEISLDTDLDCVNLKEMLRFCCENAVFSKFLDFLFQNFLDYVWTWTDLANQGWI